MTSYVKCGGVLTNNCAKRKEKETNEQTKVRKEKENKLKKNEKKKKKKKKKKDRKKRRKKKSRVIKFCNCSFVIFLNNCGDRDDVTMFYYIL